MQSLGFQLPILKSQVERKNQHRCYDLLLLHEVNGGTNNWAHGFLAFGISLPNWVKYMGRLSFSWCVYEKDEHIWQRKGLICVRKGCSYYAFDKGKYWHSIWERHIFLWIFPLRLMWFYFLTFWKGNWSLNSKINLNL